MNSGRVVREIYDRLMTHYGPQGWWPADSAFEVMVGAILTQNTNWKNVEQAIANLKAARCLDLQSMLDMPPAELAELIRPAGYYNVKTKRLRALLEYLMEYYAGDAEKMRQRPLEELRPELLGIKGIGPETADSILLYAFAMPSFVVDAYTHRVFSRHHLVAASEASYDELQDLCADSLEQDVQLYNEYHALLVAVGKECCRAKNPRCEQCPLHGCNW